jgi:hypothetical protein
MKRGFIGWDPEQLPRAVLEQRLLQLQQHMADLGVQALVAFSDVWRSNDVRYISNYMPYWNRALTVTPPDGKPILLCALSPRVYPWIRSVTIHETIVPSPNLVLQLVKLCAERGWARIGMLDHAGLPYDLYQALAGERLEVIDVPRDVVRPGASESELAMHRRAAELARAVLEVEIGAAVREAPPGRPDLTDYELTGRLERALRRAGAEDLVVLVSDGRTPPVPASGKTFGPRSSVMLALEYSGHWVKLSRNAAGLTSSLPPESGARVHLETLSRASGWEDIAHGEAVPGVVVSLQVEIDNEGHRLYYGDTCVQGRGTVEML